MNDRMRRREAETNEGENGETRNLSGIFFNHFTLYSNDSKNNHKNIPEMMILGASSVRKPNK